MKYKRKPPWLRMPGRGSEDAASVRSILRKYSLRTVCRQAMCPNIGHCFQRGTATFLILGEQCTRKCLYCAIGHSGTPAVPDPEEPKNVARAAAEMDLEYVVITSVTRDDLEDGGAEHFAETVRAVREEIEEVAVEVLTPDFKGDTRALKTVAEARPDVFNHNLETVESLFSKVRPEASYRVSLQVLEQFEHLAPSSTTKSGLMLGLGEDEKEIETALSNLLSAGVEMLTLGQYLQPSRKHWPVDRYLTPEEFENWKGRALAMGFRSVASGPLVRSSFHADEGFLKRD